MFFKSPRPYIVILALCVLGLLLYARALWYPFVHDDLVFIQLNPYIARWDNILDVFFRPGLAVVQDQMRYYRPLLEVIYRLEYLVFGMEPWGFHLVNILLHGVAAGLVYLLARQLRCAKGAAVFISILFLVHPVQSEAVTCVAGISNLAVAVLMLGALVLHITGRRQGKCFYWPALLMAGAACFVKEQALVLVALVGLYEVLFRRGTWGSRVRVLAPFLMISGLFLAWRIFLFPGFGANVFVGGYESRLRLLAIPRIIVTDLGLVFWPAGLHYYRSIDILAPYALAWIVLAALTGLVVIWFRRITPAQRRLGLFGLGFSFFTFLPALNIFPLINEYSNIMAAEHFIYLSLAGFLLMMTALLAGIFRRFRCAWLVAACFSVIIIFAFMTVRQSAFWRSETVLFERTLAFEPQLGRVHLLLGRAYGRDRRFSDAIWQHTAALRILENYVKRTPVMMPAHRFYEIFVKEAHDERGAFRMVSGDLHGAIEDYKIAVSMAHNGLRSSVFGGNDSASANNLGMLLLQTGDRLEAREMFRQALKWDRHFAPVMNNLGMMALQHGDRVSARFWFRRALKTAPGFTQARDNYNKAK
ncbi:MAG: tetratricopeptide repeat protein [Candidatus Omnitrophica bacterium]|nr:tetratricopeptide repeat protein [Candidatus Omnitrophota bacterium]